MSTHPTTAIATKALEVQVVAQPGDEVSYRRRTGNSVYARLYHGTVVRLEVFITQGATTVTYHVNAGRRDGFSTTDRIHKVDAHTITHVTPRPKQ